MSAMHRLRRRLHDTFHEGIDPEYSARPDFSDAFTDVRRAHGPRRARLFDPGDMKLLVLHILATEHCHGYEIIRVIGEMVGNGYSPSPGTIYPTLALLEDTGLVTAQTQEGGRKRYRITDQGLANMHEQQATLDELLERLASGRKHPRRRGAPEVERAVENLKTALRIRAASGEASEETIQRIAEIIDQAASAIGRVK